MTFRPDPKPPKKEKKRYVFKRTPIKRKYKPTGELALFIKIWEKRKHVSFLSGKKLDHYFGTDLFVSCFSHCLEKKHYPATRLLEDNIIMITPEEHFLIHNGTEDQRKKYALENNCFWEDIEDYKQKLIEKYKIVK